MEKGRICPFLFEVFWSRCNTAQAFEDLKENVHSFAYTQTCGAGQDLSFSPPLPKKNDVFRRFRCQLGNPSKNGRSDLLGRISSGSWCALLSADTTCVLTSSALPSREMSCYTRCESHLVLEVSHRMLFSRVPAERVVHVGLGDKRRLLCGPLHRLLDVQEHTHRVVLRSSLPDRVSLRSS